MARERQLNTLVTDEHSFDWVWESDFVEWLKCDAKVFWIAGKPASGKSTLVNYVMKHSRTKEIVEGALGGDLIVAKFFFDFRARDGLRNNFEGLRRSLLRQLLETSDALAAEVMQQFGINRPDDQIMLADATMFEYALDRNDRLTLLFVDGLDEYQGNKPELLSLIHKITESKVKVCLSSRYEKPFTMTFNDSRFQFRMELLNRPGIYAYAKHILETTLRPSDGKERSVLHDASDEIADSSSGVFLWARFAVSEFIDRICEGYQTEDRWIRTIIRSMPPELEDVYARIFQNMKDKDKNACGIVLALIDAAKYDLELSELFEATLLAGNNFRSLDVDITAEDLSKFERYLEAIGAGLIHCFVPDDVGTYSLRPVIHVTMIHRSVQTYLDSRGWKQLLGEQRDSVSHHELWLNICHDYLEGRRVRWIAPARLHDNVRGGSPQLKNQKLSADRPPVIRGLREYVYTFLPYHAFHYERETAKSSRPLIQTVLDPQFVWDHIQITLQNTSLLSRVSRVSCYECEKVAQGLCHVAAHCSVVQLAVSHRLSLFVEEVLRSHPEAFRSDSFVSALVSADPSSRKRGKEPHTPRRHLAQGNSSAGWRTSALDGPRASPLATAVLWSCHFPSPLRSGLVLLLAPHSSRLKGSEMLMAIGKLSMLEIEALLIHFPQGPLYFHSWMVDHDFDCLGDLVEGRILMGTKHPYGPLWEVGARFDMQSIPDILRLFLRRGEIINAQCGPIGTIFHSVALHQLLSDYITWSTEQLEVIFGMLSSHGGDINATGPEGTVLDFVWNEAHLKSGVYLSYRMPSFPLLIRALIKLGASNSMRDPNGLIPSKARMLAVAEAKKPTIGHVEYYFHGTCSDSELEVHLRQLDGLS